MLWSFLMYLKAVKFLKCTTAVHTGISSRSQFCNWQLNDNFNGCETASKYLEGSSHANLYTIHASTNACLNDNQTVGSAVWIPMVEEKSMACLFGIGKDTASNWGLLLVRIHLKSTSFPHCTPPAACAYMHWRKYVTELWHGIFTNLRKI